MDYKDLQVTQTNAACLCNLTDNAASAEIKGVEAEFTFAADRRPAVVAVRFVRRCNVQGLHRVGDRSRRTGLHLDSSGNRLQRTPETQVSGGVDYTMTLGSWGKALNFRANYTWQSDMFWATDNIAKEPSYGLLDARIGLVAGRRAVGSGDLGQERDGRALSREHHLVLRRGSVAVRCAAHLRRRLHASSSDLTQEGRCARCASPLFHLQAARVTETTAICRFCHATCGFKVTIENGQVVNIIGDIDNPVYHGYSCVKGRNYHEFHRDPRRVLHPLRRDASGELQPVAPAPHLPDIAARLRSHHRRARSAFGRDVWRHVQPLLSSRRHAA